MQSSVCDLEKDQVYLPNMKAEPMASMLLVFISISIK
jgi:hypothetical protein